MFSLKAFPKRIGKSAFFWLIWFYTLSILTIGSSVRIFIHRHLDGVVAVPAEFLADLDRLLLATFWCLLLVGFAFFLFFVFRFFYPLGLLVEKSRDIRAGNFRKKASAPIAERLGEWYELDLALLKFNKDLRRRKADVDRERSEIEALMAAANDSILAVDGDMNLRYFNEPMLTLLDQKEEDLLGRPIKSVIRQKSILDAMEYALQVNGPRRVETSYQMVSDASRRYFDISISPLPADRKGRGQGAVAIFHDITERNKNEKVRMDFVANASHELKTPLTALGGYLDILEMDKESPSMGPHKEASFLGIRKNLGRLNSLVSDLLKLTKIEGSVSIDTDKIYTEDITETIVTELRPLWEGAGHKVSVRYEAETFLGHREYAEQVLINLISNAVTYCVKPSEIQVSWVEGNRGVLLSVKDNGPGIESFHLGRIFERFYRVRDSQEAQNSGGTGLGLSIVRHAMLKQGGQVDVKSAPGLGTEFLCFFPNA